MSIYGSSKELSKVFCKVYLSKVANRVEVIKEATEGEGADIMMVDEEDILIVDAVVILMVDAGDISMEDAADISMVDEVDIKNLIVGVIMMDQIIQEENTSKKEEGINLIIQRKITQQSLIKR
jgi:hypothetical protein